MAGALPHGSCPCQKAIDKMTEELEYADQAEDNPCKFTSNSDLSCQGGHGGIHLFVRHARADVRAWVCAYVCVSNDIF